MDLDAERETLCRGIEELERSLGRTVPDTYIEVSISSQESGSENEDDLEEDSDTQVDMEVDPNGLIDTDEESEDEVSINLPQTPETCLQMNLVYQEIIQEKIEEINLLLAQNKEQQEKLTWKLAGTKVTKSGDGKSLPANMYLGHFMKPYFKDKTSGIGPPANNDTREKAKQGIKSFEELITIKWKSREKQLLHDSLVSDRLHRLLQPKLLSLSCLSEKQAKSKDEMEKQILEKQIQEKEHEINDINLLPEETLLANRYEKHDWDKIANINFEGTRSATELRKYWQDSEHPNINKKEWSVEEIEKLKEIATRYNYLDWGAIAQELGTQRTAFQCLQKFQAYNKDLKRSEWTSEEDQMLLHLVQEMRVGEHIPYRKIAYYMEGRNSAQLIYRWTRSVDPNLKHGAWTAKEDALLLKAVAKYGERDWYKIRTEVPGRNDSQCRYRYLHALHNNIKKGKWSEEEERKLVELTEKYGVGRWAKIASELPHRTASQCLSKWKVLLGYRRKRKKKPENRLRWKQKRVRRRSSTPSESSSEYSDLDLEEDSTEKNKSKNCKKSVTWHRRVPSIDLWVPTRKDVSETRGEALASVTLLSKGFDVNRKRRPVCGALLEQEQQAADGLTNEDSRNLPSSQNKEEEDSAEKSNHNAKSTKDSWRVSLAYVRRVLTRNNYELQRRNREIRRKKRFASDFQGLSSVSADSRAYKGYGQKDGIWRTSLTRRLMMAVTPWAGSMVQNWALRVKREASAKTKAEFIFKHLQSASLTSTPLFTLFIQLLRVDVDGCMKVIQRRRLSELLKSVVNVQRTDKASSSKDPKAQHDLQVANPPPGKKLIPLKAKNGPVPDGSRWEAVPYQLASKPKTVSELLQEKRLKESKAKKAEQNRLLMTPQLLLSSPMIIQPQRAPTTQMASGPQQIILPAPVKTQSMLLPLSTPCGTPLPSTMESNLASLPETARGLQETVLTRNGMGEDPLGNRSKSCSTGSVLPRASPGLPRAACSLPVPTPAPLQLSTAELPMLIASQNSSTVNSGMKKVPCFAAQGPPGSLNNPGSVVPTLVTTQPSVIPKQILPITWVLTPQGLVPMTVVNLPSQGNSPASCPTPAPNLGQAAGTSFANVSAVNVVPVVSGLNSPQPGPLLQRVTSSSCPQNKGVTQQMDLTFCPSPPPLARESQSRPSTACSPVHLLSTTPSLSSTQPGIPRAASVVPQDQMLGKPLCPAPPNSVKSAPNPVDQSNHTCPAVPPLQEKIFPDYSLLSLEDVAAVKEWLKGGSYRRVPTSEAHLPYLPPFLCSLKTLSALLLNKKALEHSAASLVTPEGQQKSVQPDLDALRTMVQQKLWDNPAYRLLKGRFLAMFTFPSALAALPPLKVTTTLSDRTWWEICRGEDERPSSEEEEDSMLGRRTTDPREEQEENPPELEASFRFQLPHPQMWDLSAILH
ncbi:snRNA-activating protein complex subunit 4 isoform X2 [Sceloporus undulatus]|uniref:snRNA-activating protein complex subunit 4 isoform X2 n=1 Tax=Sceloporus undulatus TaxID=8520 RepID=UPI001C4BFB0F|nr:snRNA-activating protein complex subunit 4 isoform X2 [Sceloporus undulatus]